MPKFRVICYTSRDFVIEAENESEAVHKAIAECDFYPDYSECYEEEEDEDEED